MEIEDPSLQSFLTQFEPDGADYLYRSPSAAAPIRVTAAERQAFRDAYARRVGGLIWILLVGILTSTLFMLADLSILHVPHGVLFVMVAYAASFVAWGLASQYLMHAPERVLRNRIPPHERLGWIERYKRMLMAKSWRGMGADGAFVIFLLGIVTSDGRRSGVDPLLLVLPALFLVQFAFNVILKLSLGSARR
jgi:hypothetical protein